MRKYVNIYLIFSLFYGVIIKLTFNIPLLFKLKTYIPEICLIIIITMCLINILKRDLIVRKNKFLYLIVYIIGVFILNLFKFPSSMEIMSSIKDFILPMLTLALVLDTKLSTKEIKNIVSDMVRIFCIFIVLGFILAIIQKSLGSSWTSRFYTGYEFFMVDPVSKVKIWFTSSGELRVPSLTGSSVSFGFYNLIAFIMILNIYKKPYFKYTLLCISILNIIMSTNKTAFITCVFIIFINIGYKFNSYIRQIWKIIIPVMLMGIISIALVYDNKFLYSMYERFDHWNNVLSDISILELLIPLNFFKTTAFSNTGALSILDNTYLYLMISLGIVGLLLTIYSFCSIYHKYVSTSIQRGINYLLIAFFTSSFTVNLTQGRAFFNILCLIVPILYKASSINDKMHENISNNIK